MNSSCQWTGGRGQETVQQSTNLSPCSAKVCDLAVRPTEGLTSAVASPLRRNKSVETGRAGCPSPPFCGSCSNQTSETGLPFKVESIFPVHSPITRSGALGTARPTDATASSLVFRSLTSDLCSLISDFLSPISQLPTPISAFSFSPFSQPSTLNPLRSSVSSLKSPVSRLLSSSYPQPSTLSPRRSSVSRILSTVYCLLSTCLPAFIFYLNIGYSLLDIGY